MSQIARRNALGFAVLAVATYSGAVFWRPTARLADTRPKIELESLFPKQFDDWVMDSRQPIQLISPDTAAMLNKIYNQTLSRTYVNGAGERIMLSVAYGGDQSDATRAHRPEVCYPAQGFQVRSARESSLQLPTTRLAVRLLVAQQGNRVEPITYWITVGERIATSGPQQKIAQLAYTTRGVIPDGMLVRVSSISADDGRAFQLQKLFIEKLAASIPANQRTLVVGAPAA